jgi:hypothetical protein
MSRRQELIRAIELMQKPENVHLTQCRCGSRLPWNQCHGAPVPGQSDVYIEGDNRRLHWRYSPKAACPCKLTNKEHYNCCWFTSTPFYKNDTSGGLVKLGNADENTIQAIRLIKQMKISKQDMTMEELRTSQTALIRAGGLQVLDDYNGRRCGVKDWDPMVYAGIF